MMSHEIAVGIFHQWKCSPVALEEMIEKHDFFGIAVLVKEQSFEGGKNPICSEYNQ